MVIAEDDTEQLELMATAFERSGYRVTRARNGRELAATMAGTFFRKRRSRNPDILITDVHMPAFSGLEVLQSFRDANCEVPTIIVTADPRPYTMRTAQRLGATVLIKPLAMADVIAHAEQLLAKGAA